MTRDEIINMARLAGGADITSHGWTSWIGTQQTEFLERFANLVVEHLQKNGWRECARGQRTTQYCGLAEQARLEEREACMKAVEQAKVIQFVCYPKDYVVQANSAGEIYEYQHKRCLDAIRERGDK